LRYHLAPGKSPITDNDPIFVPVGKSGISQVGFCDRKDKKGRKNNEIALLSFSKVPPSGANDPLFIRMRTGHYQMYNRLKFTPPTGRGFIVHRPGRSDEKPAPDAGPKSRQRRPTVGRVAMR
jgi:hypothetical protein